MSDVDDFMKRYHREEERRMQSATETLQYVAPALQFLGVRLVKATFDGAGDEGWLDPLQYDPPPTSSLPDGLGQMIESAFENLLPGGWEIDSGSSGTISLDTATGKHTLQHEWRDEEDDEFDEDEEDEDEEEER